MAVNSYRVLVADDHGVVRHGLRVLLESQPGVQVCGEARTGLEAIDYVKKEKPDLLILDLTMPDMNGLEVMRTIRKESSSTDVVILTMHFSEEVARELLRCGALGYVLKSDADTELLAALDHARHHQPFFTGRLADFDGAELRPQAGQTRGLRGRAKMACRPMPRSRRAKVKS